MLDNVVSGVGYPDFGSRCISLSNANACVIQGNTIGTDVGGTVAIPNDATGIAVTGSDNTIGGLLEEERNLIAACSAGIVLSGSNTFGNLVQGNILGDISGGTALGFSTDGVVVTSDAHDNQIGPGNIIAGNGIPAAGAPAWAFV